jgi:hypothetical protein
MPVQVRPVTGHLSGGVMDDEFYSRYDVMPPQMDTFGASRRETWLAGVLIGASFLFGIICIVGSILWG